MSKVKDNTHILASIEQTRSALRTSKLHNIKLNTDLKPITGQISLSSASAVSTYADSSPIPTTDTELRGGWLFKKTVADASKFNYYFYSQGNKEKSLLDIKGMNSIISIDQYTNTSSIPFFVIYTTMDALTSNAGSWYKSKIAYAIDNTIDLIVGEMIEIYSGEKPTYKGYRQVPLKTEIITGNALSTEKVLTMSIHSDSASVINTQILVKSVGFNTLNINRKIELSN